MKKKRTRREIFGEDFGDRTYPTSLDWPTDLYLFTKALAKSRGTTLNLIMVEAVWDYLCGASEFKKLLP